MKGGREGGGGGAGLRSKKLLRDYRLNVFIENRLARDTFVDHAYVRVESFRNVRGIN